VLRLHLPARTRFRRRRVARVGFARTNISDIFVKTNVPTRCFDAKPASGVRQRRPVPVRLPGGDGRLIRALPNNIGEARQPALEGSGTSDQRDYRKTIVT